MRRNKQTIPASFCKSRPVATGNNKKRKTAQKILLLQKLRIAFITYEFPTDIGKGGIGTYVQQVAAALANLNADVHVFAASFNTELGSVQDGFSIHRTLCSDPVSFRMNVLKTFDKIHSATPFHVIESPEINGNGLEIKKKYPEIPMIVRLHAPDYLVESLKKKYVPFTAKLRFVLGSLLRLKWNAGYWKAYKKEEDADYNFIKLSDAITAPSEAMKTWTVKNWDIKPENITVIPNLFSPSQALLKIPLLEGSPYKRIVFFGRLNVLKGLVNATKAMKKILLQNADWQFRIIGDDGPGPKPGKSMRQWMKEQYSKVSGQIEFFDGVDYDKLPVLIAECEIVLLPSLFESFSYTCAEAMAAGKAIVGSKVGGMTDLLKNGKCGLLADPDSHIDIYKKISSLIKYPLNRYSLSQNARTRIVSDYNIQSVAHRYLNFYDSARNEH